jgi:hypothetical protein
VKLEGTDVAETIFKFAVEHGVTPHRRRTITRRTLVAARHPELCDRQAVNNTADLDVLVVSFNDGRREQTSHRRFRNGCSSASSRPLWDLSLLQDLLLGTKSTHAAPVMVVWAPVPRRYFRSL